MDIDHESNPRTDPMQMPMPSIERHEANPNPDPKPSSSPSGISEEECAKPSKLFETQHQISANPRFGTKFNSSQNSDQVKSCLGFENIEKSVRWGESKGQNRPQISTSTINLIYELRKDQDFSMLHSPKFNPATISASSWVSAIWKKFLEHSIPQDIGMKVVKIGRTGNEYDVTDFLHRLRPNSLIKLQLFSRNEELNVTGIIKRELYSKSTLSTEVITSLKDLVRQTVIVSPAQSTHFGGYRIPRRVQSSKVYVCDLSALQFQNKFNTGRLVLISRYDTLQKGVLDDEISRNVVGEAKSCPEFRETQRYIPCKSSIFGEVLFDKVAYKRFVAKDVVLAGLALNREAARDHEQPINFKFLKYGSGFFAGDFTHIIETNILSGVLDGL